MLQGYARIQLSCFIVLILFGLPAAHADDAWLPVSPEELQMESEPKAPGASAIYLYRQVDRDDDLAIETVYARIKVLTEEGRKFGNVEIPYVKGSETIRSLKARTVRPDGVTIEFDDTVYDTQVVKAGNYRMMAKSFTLPNVEVGGIVEYSFRRQMSYGWVYNSRWLLSQDLFTRHAKFSLKSSRAFALRWSWPLGLPPNTEAPKERNWVIRLETRDVTAFVSEDYMPPEDLMKFRVEFIYEDEDSRQKEPQKYWQAFGKRTHKRIEKFVGGPRALEKEVAEIVQPGDTDETKVRKIYARTMQIRNLSFEPSRTEQEVKREQLADISNAKDVWRHGYGSGAQITWFFMALVRAANIEAHAVLVPTRDDYFFDPREMRARQLNSNAVLVKLNGRDVYLDPGTPFTPFGLLPWNETAVSALRLDQNGGTWVEIPLPPPTDARVERKASLTLIPGGTLEGKLTMTYTGLEASWRRFNQRNEDATNRIEFLENDVQSDVPSGIEVKLTNTPDWAGFETPLVAEFDLKIPGWAARAGQRALLAVGLFGGSEKRKFEHAARVHPLYFTFPYQHLDDVTIELPPGWQVSSVPKARANDITVAKYNMTTQADGGSLKIKRELTSSMLLVQTKFYGQVRDFFQNVRAGDEDQAVLQPGAPVAVSSR